MLQRFAKSIFHASLHAAVTAPILVLALMSVAGPAQAQTFTVIHNFSGGGDGDYPEAGLAIDAAGNLYGTTEAGAGTVFKLAYKGSGWVLATLHTFDYKDGAEPFATPILGRDGVIYGTTGFGATSGTVYSVRPAATRPTSVFAPWTENTLYSFTGGSDGSDPDGGLVFDQTGNLYGTTVTGGYFGNQVCVSYQGCGVVYKLTPTGGGWTESVLYAFTGPEDGDLPEGGVTFDDAGNIYGTTTGGGANARGMIYELTPSGSGWTETMLHSFQGDDGFHPIAGLTRDAAGNFYGTTLDGGLYGGGVVFMLTPAGGGWNFSVIYNFIGSTNGGPYARLVMDATGNLYGTTAADGKHQLGSVFKLTPSNGVWTYTSLHDFTGGNDGEFPYGGVVLDPAGNLYGTAAEGGYSGNGVIYEITP